MKIQRLAAVIMFLCLLPFSAFAGQNPSIKGVYTEVQGQQYKYDGKTVEIIEFMSFYCGGCYAFEKALPVIKGNFPKKIKMRILPVYWGNGSPKPGEAYFLAEEAGKGEQMKKAIFNAQFVEKKDIGSVEVLESIGAKLGLGFDFSRKLRSGEKSGEAQKALEMAKIYRLEETPTLIINGNIAANMHSFNHNIDAFRDNVITIIKSIVVSK
ncbi:MAG: DsbA family protein [Deltaproteobacteria bacterium]